MLNVALPADLEKRVNETVERGEFATREKVFFGGRAARSEFRFSSFEFPDSSVELQAAQRISGH